MKLTKEKIATAIKNNKLALGASLGSQTALMLSGSAFAEETTGSSLGQTLATSLTSGLQTAVNDFVVYVTAVLPLGLTVFGAVWGIKKAMGFFRTSAGR